MKDNNQNNNNSQPIVLGELKKEKSKVVISCAYPGPVKTNFNKNF